VVLAFFAGGAIGTLAMALATAAKDDTWKAAYLNCRERLWKLESEKNWRLTPDEEHA
jgi:hypothetical protein